MLDILSATICCHVKYLNRNSVSLCDRKDSSFGEHLMGVIYLLPMAALGILLIFAGAQLSLTLLDMKTRKEMFVPILVVGITLASNLAAGFIVGIAVAYALRSERLHV